MFTNIKILDNSLTLTCSNLRTGCLIISLIPVLIYYIFIDAYLSGAKDIEVLLWASLVLIPVILMLFIFAFLSVRFFFGDAETIKKSHVFFGAILKSTTFQVGRYSSCILCKTDAGGGAPTALGAPWLLVLSSKPAPNVHLKLCIFSLEESKAIKVMEKISDITCLPFVDKRSVFIGPNGSDFK